MMRFCRAIESHFQGGRKRAAVCSTPPSDVGVGITTSRSLSKDTSDDCFGAFDKGRRYMYICVVKRLGTLVGVTHRVNGISPSGIS